ncbi:MAG TPA: FAD-dependent oxidoreductase [Chitinophagaceae bacterium]|nr:FAD-dependent oxidoreductase [Chitinophagaceae bacterium]
MKAIVIGGGIIGLSSAFYLRQSGWEVTVLDKGDFQNNCSYGNAGYICPSHFVPLAKPGIVNQGLKLMLNPTGPFYIQPRLHWPLINWGMKFVKAAQQKFVDAAAIPLRDIALLSMRCYDEWKQMPAFDFYYEKKGILELYQTPKEAHHAEETVHKAQELGLDTELLTGEQVQQMEPHTKVNAMGAIYFKCDAHCYPNDLMKNLLAYLKSQGVQLQTNEAVTGFEKDRNGIRKVITGKTSYDADVVVLATGSWTSTMAGKLGLRIPMVAGRGYSVTTEDEKFKVNYPSVLIEGRVAITPMNGRTRFGGTMEITSMNTPARMERVKGILSAVKRFFPEFDVPMPTPDKVWHGYRPCSADGLPYLGRAARLHNLIVATGHSMLGLSLGPGTGKLVAEIANETAPSMDIRPFRAERYA